MKIDFFKIEDENLVSYNYFFERINRYNLIEFNGYRIRNIFSIVFNQNIKNQIVNDLFSPDGELLSSETKNELFRNVSLDERNELKSDLSSYLENQIESGWFQTVNQIILKSQINIILLPLIVKNNQVLSVEFKRIFPNKKIIDWISFDISKKALILDYNHSWNRKNIFCISNVESKSIFLNHFFANVYKWKVYLEEKNLFSLYNTPVRQALFGNLLINDLESELEKLKPDEKKNEHFNFFDIEHKNSFNAQDELILHFGNNRQTKYLMSSSFLIDIGNRLNIVSAWDLVNFSSKYEGNYACNIEYLISRIDLSKLKLEIEKENSLVTSVDKLWERFNLNSNDGKLWKQLLFLKSKEVGVENVYNIITDKLNGRPFVSLNTFSSTYCNPSNPTITPREKIVFLTICRFLDLPLEYMLLMQRERNLTGENSQERNINLKKWITALVEGELLYRCSTSDFFQKLSPHLSSIVQKFDIEYFGLTEETLAIACKELVDEVLIKLNFNKLVRIQHIILS
jgi:hypothetical protein